MLKGIILGNLGNLKGNMMRTCLEHIGNKEEKQNFNAPKRFYFVLYLKPPHRLFLLFKSKSFCMLDWGNALLLWAFSLNFVLEEWEVHLPIKPTNFPITHAY